MAFILKQHDESQKGILMFTHKEANILSKAEKSAPQLIKQIKEHYFIGMHFGWHRDNPVLPPMLDFVLEGKSTVENLSADLLRIPLLSRDFVPVFFGETPREPDALFWDITCIAHNAKAKRLDDFIVTMRKVLDKRPGTKILLVTSGPAKQREPHFYASLRKDYETLFTAEERQLFSMIDYRRQKNELYALGYRAVPWILTSTKIFTLYSQVEGGSKIISEALVSGTPVVARKDLIGGGLDHLDAENSALFSAPEEAAEIFVKKLDDDKAWHIDREKYAQKMREDHTFTTLKGYLQTLYGEQELKLDFISNLARKLPAHENILPVNITSPATDDLNSPYAVELYLREYALEAPLNKAHKTSLVLKAQLYVIATSLVSMLRNWIK